MSEARVEERAALLEHWQDGRLEGRQRIARRRRRIARNWSHSVLNKAVCFATIAILMPAIFAVWIAIKRSAPAKPAIGPIPQSDSVDAEPSMLISMKPDRVCVSQHLGNLQIETNRAISA